MTQSTLIGKKDCLRVITQTTDHTTCVESNEREMDVHVRKSLIRVLACWGDTSLSGTWVCEMDMQSLFNHMKLDEMIIESLTWRECFLWRFVKHSSFIFNTSLWTSSGVTVSPRRRASIMTVETWIALSSSLISRRIWFRRMKDSFFSYPSVQTTNETSRSWRTSSCRVICCLMAASSFRKASSCFSI